MIYSRPRPTARGRAGQGRETPRSSTDTDGFPPAVARALLYHTLRECAEGSRVIADISVVTGQGHGSGSEGPVLPAATRKFLLEDCRPPLAVNEVKGNPGMFILRAEEIDR